MPLIDAWRTWAQAHQTLATVSSMHGRGRFRMDMRFYTGIPLITPFYKIHVLLAGARRHFRVSLEDRSVLHASEEARPWTVVPLFLIVVTISLGVLNLILAATRSPSSQGFVKSSASSVIPAAVL